MDDKDVKNAAEPSAAAPVQFDSWDEKGNPIVSAKTSEDPPKSEEPAASAASAKETHSEPEGKSAAETETAKEQEKPRIRKPGEKLSAGEEIAKLRKEKHDAELKAKELEERLRSREPEPKPATSDKQPKSYGTYQEWRKDFSPKAWKDAYLKEYAKEHPDAQYDDAAEEATLAMADFLADVRDRFRKNEEEVSRVTKEIATKMEEAKTRYSDFEEIIRPATQTLFTDQSIPMVVKAKIDKSEVAPDLVYALASDKKAFDKFLAQSRTDPVAALDYVYEIEMGVKAELKKASQAKPEHNTEKVEAKPESPAETKPRAPKPPAEVGGRGASSEDPAVAAARTGDFRAFEAEQNRRAFAPR